MWKAESALPTSDKMPLHALCKIGYDLSVTTFSPDGRVFQIEYAAKGIEKSGTAMGIRCVDGVVVGAEKVIISKMVLPSSNRRVHTVGMHNGITLSGIAADARQVSPPWTPLFSFLPENSLSLHILPFAQSMYLGLQTSINF